MHENESESSSESEGESKFSSVFLFTCEPVWMCACVFVYVCV